MVAMHFFCLIIYGALNLNPCIDTNLYIPKSTKTDDLCLEIYALSIL